ncbi:MAG: hypothetical protein GX580_11465, partial [Candidatus Hydrogenedens sp.]|nr:hypothetical protein [Candidatus Hydrogenedens sp.]
MSEQPVESGSESRQAVPSRRQPAYYGRVPYAARAVYYGSTPYYGGGGYGAPYYYGGGARADDDDSLTGAVTLARVLRVCVQHWVTILVFVILGAVVSFFVFKISPTIFEASSILEMSIRPPRILTTRGAMVEGDSLGSLEEVFNTRLARLRSRAMLEQVMARYHADHPNSTVPEEELINVLASKTELTLQRRSRLVRVSVRSTDRQLAADLANAYALTAETFTQEENKLVSEEAVA